VILQTVGVTAIGRIQGRGAAFLYRRALSSGLRGARPFEHEITQVRANEQFFVNLVPFSLAQEMRITSIAFPKGVEE
jgi:hypothetical protein